MTFLARIFPSYALMESALIASRREAEDLRADLQRERDSWSTEYSRVVDLQLELDRIREERISELKQTANFMAYAKTARMIFVEPGNNLPLPAPPVTPEQLGVRPSMPDLVAQAKRQFREAFEAGQAEQVAA